MTRQVHVTTSLEASRLRVNIIDDSRDKLYFPGVKSASRLNEILRKAKSHQVIIDSFGPSIIYDIPKQAVYPPPGA